MAEEREAVGTSEAEIAVHWGEEVLIHPTPDFIAQANMTDPSVYNRFSLENFTNCFKEYADLLDWYEYWHTTLDTSDAPCWKWFVGGKINASYNCVDRHLAKNRNKTTIHFAPEPINEQYEHITYQELFVRVNELAAARFNIAWTLRLAGDAAAPEPILEHSLALIRRHSDIEYFDIRYDIGELGTAKLALGKLHEALALLDESISNRIEVTGRREAFFPGDTMHDVRRGEALLRLRRDFEAREQFRQAVDFWRDFDPEHPMAAEAAWWYGHSLIATGEVKRGKATVAEARPRLAASFLPHLRPLATAAKLTAHVLSPEALKMSFEKKARAYLPKEKLGEIVPFLEDVLKYEYLPGWKRVMDRLKGFFDTRFESDWEKKTGLPWQEWAKKPADKQ